MPTGLLDIEKVYQITSEQYLLPDITPADVPRRLNVSVRGKHLSNSRLDRVFAVAKKWGVVWPRLGQLGLQMGPRNLEDGITPPFDSILARRPA